MKLKVHYAENKGNPCNQRGSILCQTKDPKKVTCKKCKRALKSGIQLTLGV